MIPGSANPLLLATAAPTGYNIERSLRFNSSDSAYLSRTPASAGNRKTWTWAGWVKRTNLGSRQMIFGNLDSVAGLGFDVEFLANDSLDIYDYSFGYEARRNTTQVFRDCSSWYHIVIVYDSTNATAADRLCLYVNNSRVTAFANSTDPTLNADGRFNTAVATSIGRSGAYNLLYLNGYLADVHFIDGQALTPSSFTEVSATTGQLIPKAYTGSFGTNGFWLKFSDNSAATATTLGKDYSGNGHNWTPTNLSVTAGAGNDSLVDTPTSYGTDTGVGGEVRGNYCTLNPLDNGGITLANGNLDSTYAGGFTWKAVRSTIGVSAGKYYWEFTSTSNVDSNNGPMVGLSKLGSPIPSYPGFTADSWGYNANGGSKFNNATGTAYGAGYTNGDVIGVAFDADNGTLTFYKNNVSQGTAFTGLTSGPYAPAVGFFGTSSGVMNFGQRPFAYTAPSGYKALCDTNIAEGSITTSGTFTGNANADGPFVWLNGVPTAMTINSNAVTFGTHADKLANGFKLRTSSTSYNTAGSNTYSITTTGAKFKYARAQSNP